MKVLTNKGTYTVILFSTLFEQLRQRHPLLCNIHAKQPSVYTHYSTGG